MPLFRRFFGGTKIVVAAFLALELCLPGPLPAQPRPDSITGDIINTSFSMVNYSQFNMRLSDFKTKLIILDFWATWCSSCLSAFPKLENLQETFKDELQIVLVNGKASGDSKEKVSQFLRSWQARNGRQLKLPIIVGDSVLSHQFAHNILPHYVWIGQGGKILGTSASADLTEPAIRAALSSQQVLFTGKQDINPVNPLYLSGLPDPAQVQQFTILLKGWQKGLPGGIFYRSANGIKNGLAITNMPLLKIYELLIGQLNPNIGPDQFILEGLDSASYFAPNDTADFEAWYTKHLYSIDLVAPGLPIAVVLERMLTYLNDYSCLSAKITTRPMLSWILVSDRENMGKKKNVRAGNIRMSLTECLDELKKIKHTQFCIDETGLSPGFTLSLAGPLNNESVTGALRKNGLKLVPEWRHTDVVVVTENQKD
ncbi:hypothetical protein FPE01S_03_01520 [Flavihumibacter petaseus NBRC 106054]|uniref:Thioredoxin domain-containing protein n=2 Tax=Flavihumibacter TaxID=1004301 RepID=A0A0E9N2V3_9BACT|nr:hypothetical protein FPE01S_03_01520 [Flavihumibacter petaseus NBRC 106054]